MKATKPATPNFGGRTLDIYLVGEILPGLVGALVIVIVSLILGFLFEIAAPLIAKGANPVLILKYIALRLPEAISRGLPFALLFAVLLALSRLTQDSELKAAITHGISPARLAAPVLGLGAVVALVSFVNAQLLVPKADSAARGVQKDIVLDNPRLIVSDGQFFKDGQGQAIYIAPGGVRDSGELRGITIIQTQAGQVPLSITKAPEGRILGDQAAIEIFDGVRVTYRFGGPKPVTVAKFKRAMIPVRDLQQGNQIDELPINMPLPDLIARINDYKNRGFRYNRELTALHRKFAEPSAAIAFALFGVAVALFTLRSNQSLGMLGAIFLTFFYYATWTVFRVMGENGAMPPIVGAWAPTVVYAAAGLGLLLWARQR